MTGPLTYPEIAEMASRPVVTVEVKRHWQVQGSMPPVARPGGGHQWRKNVTAHVIAASARRAAELVEAKHEGIEIHSVNHLGRIDVIDDGGHCG